MTIKDPQGTLRRIDEQINAHNQSIAISRLEIARLQETRLVIMGLAEEDLVAAEQAKMERHGAIAGAHAVPKLIVRKEGFGDEEGSASKAAKLGLNKTGNRRGMNHPTKGKKVGSAYYLNSKRGEYKRRVLELLKNGDTMTSGEMANYFGLPSTGDSRKSLQNALHWMRSSGEVERDEYKRYFIRRPNGPAGAPQN